MLPVAGISTSDWSATGCYRTFEGVIPPGEYGAGTVLVWDEGTYRNLTEHDDGTPVPLAEALHRGHAVVRLRGRKLVGGFALTRIRAGAREAWLLVKQADEDATTTTGRSR